MAMLNMLKRNLWLVGLFVLATPLFVWLQWQPKEWLNKRIAASPLAGRISYAGAEKSFPGLMLQDASIALPDGGQLAFDNILLRPALFSLLSGSPAVLAHARGKGMDAEVVAARQPTQVKLTDIDLDLDAASLSRLDSRLLLLALKGKLALHGHMLLQTASGLPRDGDLTLVWHKPASNLLPSGLNEIRLNIHTAKVQGTAIWNWKLSSRPQQIGGEGRIMPGGPDIRQWMLRGKLLTAKDGPELVLSGTLGSPHWQ